MSKDQSVNSIKKPKNKKYLFRRFVKELKRVRWPSAKKTWISFAQVVIFTIIFTLAVFSFTALMYFIYKQTGIQTR
ncbi:preprotein translocase subunit SecE [Mycoplasmopsis felifaucium]|uniref:Preprotein translocase subunit SecE n=1 Tax=Mycoplasmopsis felifaucium TaxID=35768 RepID=A0ABZ2RPT7_9BACT|nr:preprotein translocase subunit SecE [Mycoplasmopsis felifaucium]